MITVVMLFVAVYLMSSTANNKRVVTRLQHVVNRSPMEDVSVSALKQIRGGLFPMLGSLLTGRDWAQKVNVDLERGNLRLRVGEYLALRVAMALVLAAVAIVLMGAAGLGLLVAIGLAIVGYMLPKQYVNRRIKARLTKFDEQLVEALGLVANALRSDSASEAWTWPL
jgi:Flp pilus assembly protein TadB